MALICISHTSTTWPTLATAPMLGVSVLASNQGQACHQLSGPQGQRFDGIEWRFSPEGAVLLDGASAWLECSVAEQRPAGDHDIVVLRVHCVWDDRSTSPLVFHGSRLCRLDQAERGQAG